MKRKFASSVLLVAAMMNVAGCGGGSSSSGFVAAPSSGTGGTGGGAGGTISQDYMSVLVIQQDQAVTTYLHQFNSFSSPCRIVSTSTGQDVNCILNIRELDLFNQGLKMAFNVPSGMCKYVADYPYWYYNRAPGQGPANITMHIDDTGGTTNTCTVDGTAGVLTGTTCAFPHLDGTATVEGATTCAYNYGDSGNCCSGSYNFSSTHIFAASGGTTPDPAIVNTSATWGGKTGNCVGTPANHGTSGWLMNTTTGYPRIQMTNGNLGLNRYYTVKAPLLLAGADNVFAANMWNWAGYAASPTTWTMTTSVPKALSYAADLAGHAVLAPHPSYEFQCLDESYEIINRIRVYVNEWNTNSEFAIYGATAGASGNPNASGTCGFGNDNCNDFGDWDDYGNNFPAQDLTDDGT